MSAKHMGKGRLEAFSDGVIAVIITLLALELKVPALDGVPGLLATLPTVLLYLLTFVQIGIYWVNHHYLVDDTRTVTHGVLWANLLFLFCLSLFPFAMEWVGAKGLTSFSAALYAVVSIFPGLGYMALWTQIRNARGEPSDISWAKQVASILLYAAAVLAAWYRPALSLALIAVVAVLWLLPPKSVVRKESHNTSTTPQP